MAKYTHYITVPVTTSVCVIVESDEKIKDDKQAYDMAMEQIHKTDPRFELESEGEYKGFVEMGEELEYHQHLNRGNVCHAVCPQVDWTTEEEEK